MRRTVVATWLAAGVLVSACGGSSDAGDDAPTAASEELGTAAEDGPVDGSAASSSAAEAAASDERGDAAGSADGGASDSSAAGAADDDPDVDAEVGSDQEVVVDPSEAFAEGRRAFGGDVVASPATVAPGDQVELTFPTELARGASWVLEAATDDGGWRATWWLRADRGEGPAARAVDAGEPFEQGPSRADFGPEVLRLDPSTAPGAHRLCAVGDPELCTPLVVGE